jgi:excisionase family DNA binding protein
MSQKLQEAAEAAKAALARTHSAPVVTPRGDGSYVVRPGKPEKALKVKEVAERLAVSAQHVRNLVKNGHLAGEGGKISLKALEDFLKQRSNPNKR